MDGYPKVIALRLELGDLHVPDIMGHWKDTKICMVGNRVISKAALTSYKALSSLR